MKKLLVKALMFFIALGFTNLASMAKDYYKDMTPDHWAYNEIKILTDYDVVVGYPDGNYRPDQPVTRAEFATMVVKAFNQKNAEIKDPVNFKDVSEKDWFYGMVQRAAMFDLLKGQPDNTFLPYGNITRGQVISVIINALTTEKVSSKKAEEILSKNYSDYKDLPGWLIVAAGKAEALGMVVTPPGGEGKIDYTRDANRAEVAVFICRMLEQAKLNPNEKLRAIMSPKTADGVVVPASFDEDWIATIPEGAVIPIRVLDDCILSNKTKKGEEFHAELPQNIVTKEKYLLLVEGDKLYGHITDVKKGLLFVRNGKVDMQTETITTHLDQTAAFKGIAVGPDRKEGFWKTQYLKVVKGHRVKVMKGDILNLKLLQPVTIDMTSLRIIE